MLLVFTSANVLIVLAVWCTPLLLLCCVSRRLCSMIPDLVCHTPRINPEKGGVIAKKYTK